MSAPGGILTLDVALRTGWAYGLPEMQAPLSGVWLLPAPVDSGRCYAALGNQVADAITMHGPSLVVFEAPLVRQDRSARLLLGLCAVLEATCYWREVLCREVACATARKGAMGRGVFAKGEAKAEVATWCQAQGWSPSDDNAADAMVLWEHARKHMAARAMLRAARSCRECP